MAFVGVTGYKKSDAWFGNVRMNEFNLSLRFGAHFEISNFEAESRRFQKTLLGRWMSPTDLEGFFVLGV